MKDFRFYFFFVELVVFTLAVILLFPIQWIFALIFLAVFLITAVSNVLLYFHYIWFPYHKWIDTSVVDIENVEIPSALDGKMLKGVVIRKKNSDRSAKHIGVLCHHGYTGFKEKFYRFAIPLAMNDCVVLCPDARGHGESTEKPFNMNDFKGIMTDVPKEIDFLEKLEGVDKNRLMMVGHSMGAIMSCSAGYRDARIKKIVEISGTYDMLEMLNRNKTIIASFIKKMVTGYLKKDKEFIESGLTIEDWNKKISAKYVFEEKSPIPNKDRVYLVHCKNDDLVLFDQAEKIKEALKLPDENVLFMEQPPKKFIMAAHNLTGQTPLISDFIVRVSRTL